MPKAKGASKTSAGLLMVRRCGVSWEFLLAHPGGPFFARKDDGAWSVPKGLPEGEEDLLAAAKREFVEETGFDCESDTYLPLGHVVQAGGKTVHAWAFVGDCRPEELKSNTFMLEWPPKSGRMREVPEIDRVAFFDAERARVKMNPAQSAFIDRALALLR
ncbi:MAG: NUDIX domain-containing protein [Myxococcales bacterium]